MKWFGLLLLFYISHISLWGSEALRVDMYADREQADIGEEIVLTITYSWPEHYSVEHEPNPADVFNTYDLFIVNAPPVERLSSGGREERRWRLHVLAQHSGAWSIPRPGFSASSPDGQSVNASAPEVILHIGIAEKPPRFPEPSQAWSSADSADAGIGTHYWWLVIPGALAVAVLVYLLTRKHQTPSQVDPFAHFNQSLQQAQQAHNYKEAAAHISYAVRAYCSAIWQFDGVAATNREMRHLLKPHIPAEALRKICTILDTIEDVRWVPETENTQAVQRCIVDAHTWCQEQERLRQAADAEDQAA